MTWNSDEQRQWLEDARKWCEEHSARFQHAVDAERERSNRQVPTGALLCGAALKSAVAEGAAANTLPVFDKGTRERLEDAFMYGFSLRVDLFEVGLIAFAAPYGHAFSAVLLLQLCRILLGLRHARRAQARARLKFLEHRGSFKECRRLYEAQMPGEWRAMIWPETTVLTPDPNGSEGPLGDHPPSG